MAKVKYQQQIKTVEQAREWAKCQSDPVYFIVKYCKIQHPTRGKVPFNLYAFQIALLYHWVANRYSIALKPRQMGISQLAAAYALWFALFHSYKTILTVTLKFSVAVAWLRRVKFIYESLPEFLQTPVLNGAGGNVGTGNQILFANGSEIFVQATTENSGRSDSLSLLIMDEVAFQRYASATWGAAQPTLSTGGRAVLFSSAYAVGNFFHQQYTEATAGLNIFKAAKLSWTMHPERDAHWYEEQKKALGTKRMAQEIDCNFLQAGYNVFDMAKIRAIEERIRENPPINEYNEKMEPQAGGAFKLYKQPLAGVPYLIGGDVASGRARDYSAFSIFDPNGIEYGCFKGKIGIKAYADLLGDVGRIFNWATLAPESNSIGEGVIAYLQAAGYPNIYHTVSSTLRSDDVFRRESVIAGWLTTGKSRSEIITRMDDDLTADLVEINNPYFVSEANTFIYNNSNKPIAMGKEMRGAMFGGGEDEENPAEGISYTDDSIFGACIGNYCRSYLPRIKGGLPIYSG